MTSEFKNIDSSNSSNCYKTEKYRKLLKVTTLVTFEISSLWGSLFSAGSGYFQRVVTFGGLLLAKGPYYREQNNVT